MKTSVDVQGISISISNPEKLMFPELGVTKAEYIKALIGIAPYLIAHIKGKALTAIRYPDGVAGEYFYQKRPPKGTPEWVDVITVGEDDFIHLNSLAVLVWLGNSAAIEFHTPFCRYDEDKLNALVFDLDPSANQGFGSVAECALKIYEELTALGVISLVKTSGATGLQIFIPAKGYTFEQGRKINEFFAKYFVSKYPGLMTIERLKKNRGGKLYFDYLQMWRGKNMISVYSPRAVSSGAVSMPVSWDELRNGNKPSDFNISNAAERLAQTGDLFECVLKPSMQNAVLDEILKRA